MDALPRVPFSTLSRACGGFNPATKIGEGATGEVFRGRMDGADVALKRLNLPEGATPEAKAALVRAFDSELAILSAYRHTRLVRLLCYAQDEDPASRHPFVLAFELLEEGSLADHLRGPNGEPPKSPQPPLTPLERVDAALGAAAGLAYLHGLREAGEGEGHPAAPVLHRDIKAANIGLTRVKGALYAKVLDCGLARALKGGPPGAGGKSITGGVVGTLGYMAPELSTGTYTPRSDIYAMGCVLLELLSGARMGPLTARELEEAAIDDGGGAAAVRAVAEACWPAPAVEALSALVLTCIHHSAKKRPVGVAEVLAALKGLRALVAPTAPPLVPCPVCMEDVPEAGGLQCSAAPPAGPHFVCHGCLQEHVRTKVEALAALRESGGAIPCHVGGCHCKWAVEELQDSLDKGTLVKIVVAMRRMAIDGPREAAQMAARQAAALAAAAQMALAERVAELRRVIVERDLLLRCPQCAAEFDDYNGCNALTCGRCGTGFCAVCLKDCGSSRDTHLHHKETHGDDYFNKPLFEREKRVRYLARLIVAVKSAGGEEVQRALIVELGRADLRDLGISEEEVLAGAGVGAAAQELPDAIMSPARVVALMRAGAGDTRVAEEGAKALVALTGGWGLWADRVAALKAAGEDYDSRCSGLADLGAVDILVAAIKSGAGSAAMIVQVVTALRNIAGSDPCEGVILGSGAVPAIVTCFKAYAHEAQVVQFCYMALMTVAFTTLGIDACVSSGAVPPIVACLKTHAGVAEVTQYGFMALANITVSQSGQEACVSLGAVSSIVACLQTHAGVADIALYGCKALARIAATIRSCQDACVSSGAVPVVVSCLKTHAGVADVAHWGCRALAAIAVLLSGQNACVSSDAVPAVMTCLKTHAGLADVSENGCRALACFAGIQSGQDACVSSGVVPVIVSCLKTHAGVADVSQQGSWALLNIGWSRASNQAAIVAAGAIPELAAAFGRHTGDAKQKAHEALDRLGYSDEGIKK